MAGEAVAPALPPSRRPMSRSAPRSARMAQTVSRRTSPSPTPADVSRRTPKEAWEHFCPHLAMFAGRRRPDRARQRAAGVSKPGRSVGACLGSPRQLSIGSGGRAAPRWVAAERRQPTTSVRLSCRRMAPATRRDVSAQTEISDQGRKSPYGARTRVTRAFSASPSWSPSMRPPKSRWLRAPKRLMSGATSAGFSADLGGSPTGPLEKSHSGRRTSSASQASAKTRARRSQWPP